MKGVLFASFCAVVLIGAWACAKRNAPAREARPGQPADLPAFLSNDPGARDNSKDTVVIGGGEWDSQTPDTDAEGGDLEAISPQGESSQGPAEEEYSDEGRSEEADEVRIIEADED